MADISGYTAFVGGTEQEHSQEIVAEGRSPNRSKVWHLGTRSVRNLAHCPTRLQPAGRVGPSAPLTNMLLFKYQIAV